MFNSELVIADISSINCALYSSTQFQFILANRSVGEKKSKKDKRAEITSWCHQTKPYRSIACKVRLRLGEKVDAMKHGTWNINILHLFKRVN